MYSGNSSIIKNIIKVRNKIRYARYARNPLQACRDRYKWTYKTKINLKDPQMFDEKLIYLMYNKYRYDQRVKDCIDKIEAHNYFKKKGYKHLMNEVYGIYNNLNDIDWESLPNSFVLKCNTGSGGNVIVLDKSKTDKAEVIAKLKPYETKKFGIETGAIQYSGIKARFMSERYIGQLDGTPPVDYKFYCCNGVVQCVEIIHDRFCDEKHYYVLADRDFNSLPYGVDAVTDITVVNADRPEHFKKFVEAAEKLSQEFEFVRVDLYDYQNEPLLGEMTFFPMDGINFFLNEEGRKWLGSKIELNLK